MTKRAETIKKEIVKRMYANGGHWLELGMKNGDKLYLQRANFERFEDLDRERFNVKKAGEWILSALPIEDLAKFIDENY